jgi:hypothetical protein
MTAGFEASDDAGLEPMMRSRDWVGHALRRPMAAGPGERFEYDSGSSHLLSAVVQRATGEPAASFARRHLFERIGMTSVVWPADPGGISSGGTFLEMTARDAARFGLLYLERGRWGDRRIVSEDWVRESTRRQSWGRFWSGRYGYHWWLEDEEPPYVLPEGTFLAQGWGGQFIIVIPSRRLVAVFTGRLPSERASLPRRCMERFVLPALRR